MRGRIKLEVRQFSCQRLAHLGAHVRHQVGKVRVQPSCLASALHLSKERHLSASKALGRKDFAVDEVVLATGAVRVRIVALICHAECTEATAALGARQGQAAALVEKGHFATRTHVVEHRVANQLDVLLTRTAHHI
jgi:hypothetical protein